jgi:hypothetical protein
MARLARPLRGLACFGLRFAPALANPMRPIRSASVRCSGVEIGAERHYLNPRLLGTPTSVRRFRSAISISDHRFPLWR